MTQTLFAAAPTAASRRGRLTLCEIPTLSETRGRPSVAPRGSRHCPALPPSPSSSADSPLSLSMNPPRTDDA